MQTIREGHLQGVLQKNIAEWKDDIIDLCDLCGIYSTVVALSKHKNIGNVIYEENQEVHGVFLDEVTPTARDALNNFMVH